MSGAKITVSFLCFSFSSWRFSHPLTKKNAGSRGSRPFVALDLPGSRCPRPARLSTVSQSAFARELPPEQCHHCFDVFWLQFARYLTANSWILINQATGDDSGHKMLDTKALSEAALLEVLRFVDGQAPSPSHVRIRFTLLFDETVGLRSAELLSATLGDMRVAPKG